MPTKKKESRGALMARLLKSKPKSVSENKVKKDIREYLNRLGNEVCHFHYSSINGEPGVADRIVCFRGTFLAIEVKKPARKTHKDGGLSPAQKDFANSVWDAGGWYVAAYNVDDVKRVIEDIAYYSDLPSQANDTARPLPIGAGSGLRRQ